MWVTAALNFSPYVKPNEEASISPEYRSYKKEQTRFENKISVSIFLEKYYYQRGSQDKNNSASKVFLL